MLTPKKKFFLLLIILTAIDVIFILKWIWFLFSCFVFRLLYTYFSQLHNEMTEKDDNSNDSFSSHWWQLKLLFQLQYFLFVFLFVSFVFPFILFYFQCFMLVKWYTSSGKREMFVCTKRKTFRWKFISFTISNEFFCVYIVCFFFLFSFISC